MLNDCEYDFVLTVDSNISWESGASAISETPSPSILKSLTVLEIYVICVGNEKMNLNTFWPECLMLHHLPPPLVSHQQILLQVNQKTFACCRSIDLKDLM